MMLIEEIKTGTKLKLEVYDENNQKVDQAFVSQFDYAEGNEYVILNAPLHGGAVYPIHVESFMQVLFSEEDRLYCFSAKVTERFIIKGVHFIKAKVLGETKIIQRRGDYRLKCNLPIEFRKIRLDGLEFKIVNEQFITTKVINISGGGVCVLLNEEIEVDNHLECVLNLESNCNVRFIGKIVRIEKNEQNNENYIYRAGLAYDIIDSKYKEVIIKFIFKQQRKLRRKGII